MLPRPKGSNNKDKKVDRSVTWGGIAVLFILVVVTSVLAPNNPELGGKFFVAAFIAAFVFILIRRGIIIYRRISRHQKGYDDKGRWI